MRWPALLLVLLLAGCAKEGEAPGEEERRAAPAWHAYGSFTLDATASDEAAVCAIIREREEDCVMMTSLPLQYALGAEDAEACEATRARVLRIPNTLMGACEPYPHAKLVGGRPFSLRELVVNVSDGERPAATLGLEVLAAWEAGGVVTLVAEAQGHEGEEMWMTIWYRPRDVTAGEVLDPRRHARETGAFDVLLRQGAFRGEPITRLDRLDPRSFLRVESQDPDLGMLRGSFLVDAIGACDEGDADCRDPDARPRIILHGRFS